MSSFETSSQLGFSVRHAPRLLIAAAANPGTTPMIAPLMIWLPDPNSTTAGSEFLTTLTGATANWTVRIFEITGGIVLNAAPIYTQLVGNSVDTLWVELDPALFNIANLYRVEITDDGGNIAEEWDFGLYTTDTIAIGPQDVATINDQIRRLRGLLGYYRRLTYSGYPAGGTSPATTLIELLDPADGSTVLASYQVNRVLTQSSEVTGVASAALDTNVL